MLHMLDLVYSEWNLQGARVCDRMSLACTAAMQLIGTRFQLTISHCARDNYIITLGTKRETRRLVNVKNYRELQDSSTTNSV